MDFYSISTSPKLGAHPENLSQSQNPRKMYCKRKNTVKKASNRNVVTPNKPAGRDREHMSSREDGRKLKATVDCDDEPIMERSEYSTSDDDSGDEIKQDDQNNKIIQQHTKKINNRTKNNHKQDIRGAKRKVVAAKVTKDYANSTNESDDDEGESETNHQQLATTKLWSKKYKKQYSFGDKRKRVGNKSTEDGGSRVSSKSFRSAENQSIVQNKYKNDMEQTIRRYHQWTEMMKKKNQEEDKDNNQDNQSTTDLSFINNSLDPESNLFKEMTQTLGISRDPKNSALFRQFLVEEKEKNCSKHTSSSESSTIPSRELLSPIFTRRGPPTQIRTYCDVEDRCIDNNVSKQMVQNISRAVGDYVIGTFFKSVRK